MGKWTMGYTDDVLSYKMREMICASIERIKQEEICKDTLPLSYDAVVEDFDQGDMFCSRLVDLLVAELADRRQRARPADRRMISERTSYGLRNLSQVRVHKDRGFYRDPRTGPSGVVGRDSNVSFMHPIFEDNSSPFSDDEDHLLNAVEGARINATELYDSYANTLAFPLGSHSNASRVFPRQSPSLEESNSDDGSGIPNGHRTTGEYRIRGESNSPVHGAVSQHATDLIRRPSVRRRDVSEIMARRRSQNRHSRYSELLEAASGSQAGETSAWMEPSDRASTNHPSAAFLSRRSLRRVSELNADAYASSSRLRPFGHSNPMPRLRRGGVQPPELFPFPEDRPIPGLDDIATRSPSTAENASRSDHDWTAGWGIGAGTEIVGLPTPRSTSPEENRSGAVDA